MLLPELIVVFLAIYLGSRLGGIGIGFAGGMGFWCSPSVSRSPREPSRST